MYAERVFITVIWNILLKVIKFWEILRSFVKKLWKIDFVVYKYIYKYIYILYVYL